MNAQGRACSIRRPSRGPRSALADPSGVETKSPVPGNNVVLSLDMQATARGAGGDAAICAAPSSRSIRATATCWRSSARRRSIRTASPSGLSRADYVALSTDLDKPLYNRALAGVYPPGSTVKPFIALAALQNEAMTPDEERYCPGHFRLPGHDAPLPRLAAARPRQRGHARRRSCSRATCTSITSPIAMGIDAMAAGLKQFGFGAPVGLDISGENSGIVPSREWKQKAFARREDQVWFPGETVITGIGQGYTLVTPVQLAHAGATLAARGQRFAPRLLIGTENGVTREVSTRSRRRLPSVAEQRIPRIGKLVHRCDGRRDVRAARLGACARCRARPTASPARPARRRSSASRRTRNTARRTSTSGCATTACSSRSRRPKRRGSRSPSSSRTAAAAPRGRARRAQDLRRVLRSGGLCRSRALNGAGRAGGRPQAARLQRPRRRRAAARDPARDRRRSAWSCCTARSPPTRACSLRQGMRFGLGLAAFFVLRADPAALSAHLHAVGVLARRRRCCSPWRSRARSARARSAGSTSASYGSSRRSS